MEKRKRTILVVLIGIVIVAAVFSSFGLPYFAGDTPDIVLPTPRPSADQEEIGQSGEYGTVVRVTPQTVQNVVAALHRQESYLRTIITVLEGNMTTAQVWADGGWLRTDLTTPAGTVVHTIVGSGMVWRWYGNEPKTVSWAADVWSADVDGQRIPTYEDVLNLDPSRITAADYVEKNGLPCIYVEASFPEWNQQERYWISADNGLLEAAETEADGEIVWMMSASAAELPAPSAQGVFALPDGTVLHEITAPAADLQETATTAEPARA